MQNLSSKELEMAKKRHWTVAQVCAKYNIDEEDFNNVVFLAVGKNQEKASAYVAALRKNKGKKPTVLESTKAQTTKVETDVAVDSGSQIVHTESVVKDAAAKKAMELAKLQELKKSSSDELCRCETIFYQYREQRKALYASLCQLRDEMLLLEQAYLAKEQEFRGIISKFDALGEDMNEITVKRQELRTELEVLDAEIDNLSTINVEVIDGVLYINEIEVGDAELAGFEEIYRSLLMREETELDLKKSQLMTLAKSFAYANSHARARIEFDDDDIALAFLFLTQD